MSTKMKNESKKELYALSLSGGGSRAIAYHLGCLKALKEAGILDKIKVISGVSGGSVLTALYAYSNDSFENFEKRTKRLLRKGLLCPMLLRLFNPLYCIPFLIVNLFYYLVLLIEVIYRILAWFVNKIVSISIFPEFVASMRSFIIPYFSTNQLLEKSLKKYLGDTYLDDDRRNNINVVINATELRSSTAFRFGSKESGSYRFGKISEKIFVRTAVAASAAYPLLLQPVVKKFKFYKGNENKSDDRRKNICLTDGGIYDNLGMTCFKVGKEPYSMSSNSYQPTHIICCSAGQGEIPISNIPFDIFTRMTKSFLSIMKRNQDAQFDLLHKHQENKLIDKFLLSYLGMKDEDLGDVSYDFIRREEVCNYPTNFSAMDKKDMDKLIMRGYEVTKCAIKKHWYENTE